MVAFHIFAFLVFAVAEVSPHARDSEIFLATAYRGNSEIFAWYEPPVFIKRGLHGKFIVNKGEVFFCRAVVSVFRAYMLERCQRLHLPFPKFQISKRRDLTRRRVSLLQAVGMGFAID